jgi:hypothetical protein
MHLSILHKRYAYPYTYTYCVLLLLGDGEYVGQVTPHKWGDIPLRVRVVKTDY